MAYRFGNGPRILVIMGGIHGEEVKSVDIVMGLLRSLEQNPSAVPPEMTLYLIPCLNVDAATKSSPSWIYHARYNAHCVDLNRNFKTGNWKPNIVYGDKVTYKGLGGKAPESEPETRAIVAFLKRCQREARDNDLLVLSLHQYVRQHERLGRIFPVKERAGDVATYYAQRYRSYTGYKIDYSFNLYEVTGDLVLWAEEQGIAAMDIEVSHLKRENSLLLNKTSLLRLIEEYGTISSGK
ncbi:MAG: succinylglutamate desuccinylase/aspartoacylase family protein [Spirochaetales bacterium]|nr:succinylglutamate desuccinylase/aspartoacylase family protein [Spirochaetales bacterium]